MFLPSLITGKIIKKYGHSKIIYIGVLFYIITIILSFFEQSFINYVIALIFLGLGWNFLFISGTSLVVLTYKEEEKFKVQGINDLIVFFYNGFRKFISRNIFKFNKLGNYEFYMCTVANTNNNNNFESRPER